MRYAVVAVVSLASGYAFVQLLLCWDRHAFASIRSYGRRAGKRWRRMVDRVSCSEVAGAIERTWL